MTNVVSIMLKTAAGTAPFECGLLGRVGGILETIAWLRETTWRAVKNGPVSFCALITVCPRQSQDVRLRWGRDSRKSWQKGSSVLALVP